MPPALVAFEEPENGINPRRIRMIADLLQTRAQSGETQILVTTHSPILPDLIPNESLFVCRKEEGRSCIERFESFGPLMRAKEIDDSLNEDGLSAAERILRGDFDA